MDVLRRRTGRLTYNEGATLIFFSMWELVDGFYDLNACITVDVDTLVRCGANDTISRWQIGKQLEDDPHFANGCGDRSASDFDGDDGVESSNCSLEGNEGRVLVGKDAKVAILDAETDASGDDVLGGQEPVVRLRGFIWEKY
jgi:hypothetical protein